MVGCQAAYESWGDAYTALATASLYFNQIETPHLYRAQHAAFSTLPGEGSKSCFSFPQQATSLVCRHELEHFLQKEECFSVLNSNLFHFHLFFPLFWKAKTSYLTAGSACPAAGDGSVQLEPALPSAGAELGPGRGAACGGWKLRGSTRLGIGCAGGMACEWAFLHVHVQEGKRKIPFWGRKKEVSLGDSWQRQQRLEEGCCFMLP